MVSYTTFSVMTVKPVTSVSPKSKYKVQRTYTARKGIHSAVREHIDTSGHKCCMEDIKISDKKENWYHSSKSQGSHLDTATQLLLQWRKRPGAGSNLLYAPVM